MAHYHIYLGRERGKRTIHKVGKTTQTCYARCRSADYCIGMSYEIIFPDSLSKSKRDIHLSMAERYIIENFRKRFSVVHGNEYFRTTKKQWEEVKQIFIEEMELFFRGTGWTYEVHEGWVAPNTY